MRRIKPLQTYNTKHQRIITFKDGDPIDSEYFDMFCCKDLDRSPGEFYSEERYNKFNTGFKTIYNGKLYPINSLLLEDFDMDLMWVQKDLNSNKVRGIFLEIDKDVIERVYEPYGIIKYVELEYPDNELAFLISGKSIIYDTTTDSTDPLSKLILDYLTSDDSVGPYFYGVRISGIVSYRSSIEGNIIIPEIPMNEAHLVDIFSFYDLHQEYDKRSYEEFKRKKGEPAYFNGRV